MDAKDPEVVLEDLEQLVEDLAMLCRAARAGGATAPAEDLLRKARDHLLQGPVEKKFAKERKLLSEGADYEILARGYADFFRSTDLKEQVAPMLRQMIAAAREAFEEHTMDDVDEIVTRILDKFHVPRAPTGKGAGAHLSSAVQLAVWNASRPDVVGNPALQGALVAALEEDDELHGRPQLREIAMKLVGIDKGRLTLALARLRPQLPKK